MNRTRSRSLSLSWCGPFLLLGLTARAGSLGVVITSPANNTVLAAPAAYVLSAAAGDANDIVSTVTFYEGTNLLATLSSAPYQITLTNVPAGAYSYTAAVIGRHNNHQMQATSSAVKMTVVTPVSVSLSQPLITQTNLQFNYSANTGLSYVVETSVDFTNWTSISTNVATNNVCGAYCPQQFTDEYRFYRVRRLTP